MAPATRRKTNKTPQKTAKQTAVHQVIKKNRKQVIRAVARVAHKKAWSNSKTPRITSSTFSFAQKNSEWVTTGRPQWYSNIVQDIKLKKGEHRRHIIPSHLLLSSFRNYINANPTTIESKVDAFITKYNVQVKGTNLNNKLEAVSRYLHNNPKNLFPERGDENSAIGFLPKEIGSLLKNADALLKNKYDALVQANPNQEPTMAKLQQINQDVVSHIENELQQMKTKGFGFIRPVKAEILDRAIEYIQQMQEQNYARITSFLAEEIIPSLELDLSKTSGLATQNQKAIEIYQKLDKVSNGEGQDLDFFQIMDEFLNLPQT